MESITEETYDQQNRESPYHKNESEIRKSVRMKKKLQQKSNRNQKSKRNSPDGNDHFGLKFETNRYNQDIIDTGSPLRKVTHNLKICERNKVTNLDEPSEGTEQQ